MHIYKFFCLILVHNNTFQAFLMYNLVYQLQCSSIKFCSYNFVLNKASNSNDTMCVTNNVCLTTMGAQQFSMVTIQPSCRKVDLSVTRDDLSLVIILHYLIRLYLNMHIDQGVCLITDLPKIEPIILQLTGNTTTGSHQLCINSRAGGE